MSDSLYTRFDNIFFEKTRLSIMTILFKQEKASFSFLKKRLGLSDGALYTHIEKLIASSYIAKTREITGSGVQTLYELSNTGKQTFIDYIRFLEGILFEEKGQGGNDE
jgi:predicted transcriptional regulator